MQEGRGRAQGAHGLWDRLQPGAPRDGRGSASTARGGGPDQLHRRVALAAGGQAWRGDAATGGQSVASGAVRAPRQETASQGVPGNEETPSRAAQTLVREGDGRIALMPFGTCRLLQLEENWRKRLRR